MRTRRLAALGVLVALGLAGAVAWRLNPHQRAEVPADSSVIPVTATAFRLGAERPPSVTLPPLPLVDRVRLGAASGDPVLRFGTLEVCGVGLIPGQWQRPWPEADEMTFELPPALGVDAPNAAMEQLVESLQHSNRPRQRGAALMLRREDEASEALAQLAVASHDPVIAHWAVGACLAADFPNRPRCATLARRWADLDPDNAVAWLAVADGDPGAAIEAMQRVALASRFDEHIGEVAREATRAARPEWAPFVRFQVLGRAVSADMKVIGSYSPLFHHCALAQLGDPDRRQRCEAITELLVGSGRTLLAQKIGLLLAKRLNWPEERLAPLRAVHVRADEAVRAASARAERHGAYSCEVVQADLRHVQAVLRDGEWAAFSAPGR